MQTSWKKHEAVNKAPSHWTWIPRITDLLLYSSWILPIVPVRVINRMKYTCKFVRAEYT